MLSKVYCENRFYGDKKKPFQSQHVNTSSLLVFTLKPLTPHRIYWVLVKMVNWGTFHWYLPNNQLTSIRSCFWIRAFVLAAYRAPLPETFMKIIEFSENSQVQVLCTCKVRMFFNRFCSFWLFIGMICWIFSISSLQKLSSIEIVFTAPNKDFNAWKIWELNT